LKAWGGGPENRQPAPSLRIVTEDCGFCEGNFIKLVLLGELGEELGEAVWVADPAGPADRGAAPERSC
jgi:hypothetical protein